MFAERPPALTVFDPTTDGKVATIPLTGGQQRLMLPLPLCHLEISSLGRRTVRRENVTGGLLHVKMQPGFFVVLQTVQGALASVPIAVHFEVSPSGSNAIRRSRESRMRLPLPGRYSVSAKIFLTGEATFIGLGGRFGPPSSTFQTIDSQGMAVDVKTKTIDVQDLEETQHFHIVLDGKSVEEAIDVLLRSRQ